MVQNIIYFVFKKS